MRGILKSDDDRDLVVSGRVIVSRSVPLWRKDGARLMMQNTFKVLA